MTVDATREACPDDEVFVALLDHTLGEDERRALHAHVDVCEGCAELLVTLAGLDSGRERPSYGRYIVLREVGAGGMGVVYEAFDTSLRRRVALKVLRPAAIGAEVGVARLKEHTQRMFREARLLARVVHPNVLPIYDVGTSDAQVYLAMHFVDGLTLSRYIAARRSSWREILALYLEAARGLTAAHALGVVHRDIKPGNILVSKSGEDVWVADFGLAKADRETATEPVITRSIEGSASWLETLTKTGAILGTPAYMAPEQHLGAATDARTDQFALAVSLYESLTGQRPFEGSSYKELALNTCAGRMRATPPDSAAPAALIEVLTRALASRPEDRFEDVAAMVDALERAADNLPAEPDGETNIAATEDTFIGREASVQTLTSALERHKVVVLTGPAGAGKTRLATELARASLTRYRDGAWRVDLQNAHTGEAVAIAVARAMDVPLGRRDPVAQITDALSSHTLLLLDNAEHLTGPLPALLDRFRRATPDTVHLLVTSRARLGSDAIDPFHHHALPPLPHPPPEATLAEARANPAVALLIERARAARPSFDITHDNRAALTSIVTLLDGLPLAIELAAGRMRMLDPERVLERLDRRFALLRGNQDLDPRHTTLRVAIDGSWELLEPGARAALAQLSIFAGGFTFEAADAVLDLTPWGLDPLETLESLLDQSLVVDASTLRDDDSLRFTLLESIRAYASEKLDAKDGVQTPSGLPATGGDALERRHGAFFASKGRPEAIDALHIGGPQRLKALIEDLDNLLTAHTRAIARQDAPVAAATIAAASEALLLRGPFALGAERLRQTLDAPNLNHTDEDRARLLDLGAQFHRHDGAIDEALTGVEAASALLDDLPADHFLRTRVRGHQAVLAKIVGDLDAARVGYDEAIALAVRGGDRRFEGIWRGQRAILDSYQGQQDDAARGYRAALQIAVAIDDRRFEAIWRTNLATLDRNQGRFESAMHGYQRALTVANALGDRRFEGSWTNLLAALQHDLGRVDEARRGYVRALAINRRLGNRRAECATVGNLAILDREMGRLHDSQLGFAQACALAEAIKNPRFASFWRLHRALLEIDLGAKDNARRELEGAHAELERLGLARYAALASTGLAALDVEDGRLEGARARLEAAVTVAHDANDPRSRARWLVDLANVCYQLGDTEDADAHFDEAEAVLNKLQDRITLAHLQATRGLCASEAGEHDTAARRLTMARGLVSDLEMTGASRAGRALKHLESQITGAPR